MIAASSAVSVVMSSALTAGLKLQVTGTTALTARNVIIAVIAHYNRLVTLL